MGQLSTLLIFLTLAAPTPAAGGGSKATRARIGIQAIEAKPGKDRTSGGIDPKLAAKLRTTLKLMGVPKPDLTSLAKTTRKLAVRESTTMTVEPYVMKVTCKEVTKNRTTVTVDLFKKVTDKKTKAKVKKRMAPSTTVTLTDAKPHHVMTVMQSTKKKTVFVVSR